MTCRLPKQWGTPYNLSPREMLVVECLVAGMEHDSDIAAHLFRARSAISETVRGIKAKMGCENKMQIALKWVREQEQVRERDIASVYEWQTTVRAVPGEERPVLLCRGSTIVHAMTIEEAVQRSADLLGAVIELRPRRIGEMRAA